MIVHLGDERAQPLAEREERLKPLELLGGRGREVDRIPDHAVFQEISERRGGFHADQFLTLSRRSGNVRCGHHLGKHLEPVVDGWLLLKDIQGCPAYVTRLDCVGKSALRPRDRRGRC